MRRFYSLLSVLLVFVLLFAQFSITSYASEADDSLSGTLYYETVDNAGLSYFYSTGYDKREFTSGGSFNYIWTTLFYNNYPCLIFDCPVSVSSGDSFSLTLSNIDITLDVVSGSSYKLTKTFSSSDYKSDSVKIIYSDGSFDIFKNSLIVTDTNTLSFCYSSDEAVSDIVDIIFNVYFDCSSAFSYGSSCDYNITIKGNIPRILLSGSQSSEGLIDGIIEWLKSILQSIQELPDKIGVWLQNIVDTITELPDKILEGIKGLFIPSEEEMSALSDKFDALMAERFGALYQASEYVGDFFDSFKYSGTDNEIDFPSVTVKLAGKNVYIGGWSVKLIPNGFSNIQAMLKTIVGIVCTLAFIIMLRNKFNKLIGDNT